MTVFTWLWIAWGAAFFVAQGVVLARRKPVDPFSEHVGIGLFVLVVWMIGHLVLYGLWAG